MIYDFTGRAEYGNQRTDLVALHKKLEDGEELTSKERGYLAHVLADDNGAVRIMGWCYNFREFMTLYVVKTRQCGLEERWAFTKTQVRDDVRGLGKVIYIVEVASRNDRRISTQGQGVDKQPV